MPQELSEQFTNVSESSPAITRSGFTRVRNQGRADLGAGGSAPGIQRAVLASLARAVCLKQKEKFGRSTLHCHSVRNEKSPFSFSQGFQSDQRPALQVLPVTRQGRPLGKRKIRSSASDAAINASQQRDWQQSSSSEQRGRGIWKAPVAA